MSDTHDKPLVIDVVHPDDNGEPSAHVMTPLPHHLELRREQMFPQLGTAEIERLRRFGTVKTWRAGEYLVEAGKTGPGMFVLLRGRVSITRRNALSKDAPIVEHGPGHARRSAHPCSARSCA